MSGLEDRLSLDISEALSAVAQLESAFTSATKSLQEGFDQAVASFQIPDTTIDLEANVEDVTPAIDSAIASADTTLDLDPNAGELTTAIDSAIASADTTVGVDADVSEAQSAIDSLQGETIDLAVETPDLGGVADDLTNIGSAGHEAAGGAEHAGLEIGAMSEVSKLAAGETGALTGILKEVGPAGAAAAGGVAALAVVGKELVSNALDARSAQERYNLILGEFGEVVEKIDLGGLNTNLEDLSTLLGSTGIEIENAASKIFGLGTTSGKAGPEVAKTTQEVIALAARAVALNPALGNVGDVAERLFTGLARGGRFAANFNLSLTAAEITARALGDTGKTTAADLTIYEKAAAGAALATEKLGDKLGTDIETGAQNIRTQFNSVKATFEEALESLGQPLLDPLLSSIRKGEPILEDLAGAFADVLAGLLPIVDSLADGLGPALDGIGPIAAGVGGSLKIIADVLNLIPAPLKATVISFVALNAAFKALTATKLLSGLASTEASLLRLKGLAGPAAVGVLGIGAAIELVNSQVKSGQDEVEKFLDPFVKTGQTVKTIEELDAAIAHTTATAQANRAALAGNKGGLFGDFFEKGQSRAFEGAAVGLDSITQAEINLSLSAKRLQSEFGLSSAAALDLARQGDDVVESFRAQNAALDPYLRALAEGEKATDEFWLSAKAGTLSAVDIQERAAETGVAFEDLAKSVADARQPVLDFANSVIETLPGASEALAELDEKGTVHLQSFLDTFTQKTLEAAQFVGNIQELVRRGAGDLAAEIESQGAEAGATLAAEAVRLTDKGLTDAESNIDRIHEIQRNNAANLIQIASDLNGGIALRQQDAGEEFGKKLELIPGQVDAKAEKAGADIGATVIQGTVNSILQSAEFKGLPDDFATIGFDAGIEMTEGIARGISSGASGSLEVAIGQVKNEVESILKSVFLISSPSKLTQEIGELVAEGFVVGLADIEGAADVVDPIITKMDKLKLGAADLAKATGSSVEEIVASLDDLSKAEKEITPEELLDVGKAVEALGGSKGVKALQGALAQQVSAAFGGLGGKEIADIVSKLNTSAVLSRVAPTFGVTPNAPKAFETNVVKGADAASGPEIALSVTVTPPPDATPEEQAMLVARAVGWQLQGVQ